MILSSLPSFVPSDSLPSVVVPAVPDADVLDTLASDVLTLVTDVSTAAIPVVVGIIAVVEGIKFIKWLLNGA